MTGREDGTSEAENARRDDTSSVTLHLLRQWRADRSVVARDRLVDRLYPRLMALARHLIRSRRARRVQPEAVVHQVVLEALDAGDELPADSSVRVMQWCGRRLDWRIKDEMRRDRKGIRRNLDDGASASHVADDRRRADSPVSPSAHARRNEQVEALYAAIERLPEDDQALIRDRFFLGRSFREMADDDAQGRSEAAIRQATWRAVRQRLNEILRTMGLEPTDVI